MSTMVDTMFSLGVYAYANSGDTFPSQWNNSELASGESILYSDGNVETWERTTFSLNLPELTEFVALRVCATENMFNDVTGEEFAGHYVDCVGFNIIPAPASLLSLAPASLLALGRRRQSA